MATAARFVFPYQTAVAPAFGVPGALLNFYESGTDNRLATYSDPGLTTANPNPVPADATGTFPNIFLQPLSYRVVLTDALGDEIWTADPVDGAAAGAGVQATLRTVTGNTTITSTDEILEVDATTGPISITYPLDLGSPEQVQPVKIVKVDETDNTVSIYDDFAPPRLATQLQQASNGTNMEAADIYSNGSGLRSV